MQGLHYLSRMDVQLDKLTNLISELLDLSSMKWDKLTLQAGPMDLDALIDETVERCRRRALPIPRSSRVELASREWAMQIGWSRFSSTCSPMPPSILRG